MKSNNACTKQLVSSLIFEYLFSNHCIGSYIIKILISLFEEIFYATIKSYILSIVIPKGFLVNKNYFVFCLLAPSEVISKKKCHLKNYGKRFLGFSFFCCKVSFIYSFVPNGLLLST